MRVTGGGARGRRLRAGKAPGLRPTSSRVRQALFNLLGARIAGCSFLDLYAGTGSVGVEALSRGARLVVFVEQDRSSVQTIRLNLEDAKPAGTARVLATTVEAGLRDLQAEGALFDVVYADPPWDPGLPPAVFEGAARRLQQGGVLVVEHRTSRPLEVPESLALRPGRNYRHGDATLAVFHRDRPGVGS
jgi:16S rRNA (guanine(966)-N(2))-methyltransferase RsmD